MDKIKESFEPLLISYGLPSFLVIIIVFLFYVAATKPENFKVYFGSIYQFLAWPFKVFRKKAIRFKIEGPTTRALKKIAREIPDIEIPDLVINWVNEDNLETKLKEGKAIIKLKFDDDHTRNIIKATNVYVRDAFLKHSKPYFHESLRKALDLIMTKKILLQINSNQSNLISQFFEENSIDSDEVFEKSEKIEEIDDHGLLTRIFIRELNYFGQKLLGRLPKEEHKKESDEFLSFINQIATREFDDDTPLAFNNNTLRVGILLVAKIETYQNYGLRPYLRRIKLGYANNIETFYLLARSEKVEILKQVAQELLATGNFILANDPKEFKDNQGRSAICYYIKVNQDSILANATKSIGHAIINKLPCGCVITEVRENKLRLDYDGLEGWVKKENLSILEINDAKLYFREGTYIEAIPLEIQTNGAVEFTLKNTTSDPNSLITSNFEIGKTIFAKVSYIDDNFIKVDVGQEKIEGFATRKDLTYSKFIFLHEKFSVGNEYEFEVLGYNFEKANIRLRLSGMKNAWDSLKYSKGDTVNFQVCKKGNRSFVGELEEGVEAVLPFMDLGWSMNQIEKKQTEIKLNQIIECKVKKVDIEDNVIILTLKEHQENPYVQYFKDNKGSIQEFRIEEVTPYGINGSLINSNLKVYIPKYEMSWGDSKYHYKAGVTKQVTITELDKFKGKFIGSFKKILRHPLQDIEDNFENGQVLKRMKVKGVYSWGIIYTLSFNKNNYDAFLFKGEICKNGYVEDCERFESSLNDIPLVLKKIDLEKNRLILSLKDLTALNSARVDSLEYENSYTAVILGKVGYQKKYALLISNLWIEAILETDLSYNLGDSITVRCSHKGSDIAHFIED